jgi:hypothetical protein
MIRFVYSVFVVLSAMLDACCETLTVSCVIPLSLGGRGTMMAESRKWGLGRARLDVQTHSLVTKLANQVYTYRYCTTGKAVFVVHAN